MDSSSLSSYNNEGDKNKTKIGENNDEDSGI